jgi:methionyl-tRNA formyltransferase
VKLLRVSRSPSAAGALAPGTFFWSNGSLGLATRDGALNITTLQVEGGRVLSAEQFYRGYADNVARR